MRRSASVLSIVALAALAACTSKPAPLATLAPLPSAATASPTTSAPAPVGTDSPSPSESASSPVTKDLASVFHAAAATSSEVGSARLTMSSSLPGGGSMKMSGVERWKGALAADITATIAVKGQTIVMRELISPDTIYIKMSGALAKQLPKPWLKISIKDAGAMTGINLQQMLDQAKQSDPSKQLELLAAAGNITQLADETVDGVPATHYSGKADFAKLATAAGFDAKMLATLKSAGIHSINYELWLNDQKLPIKLVEKMNSTAGPITTTITLSDYGVPVAIKLPAPGEVTDLGAMLKGRKA